MRIVQITPESDALRGGVRATAEAVAARLATEHGIESQLWSGEEVRALDAERTPLSASRLVLHYVGYGFEPRGCPRWLVSMLERWARSGDGRTLVTVFHELYASGPPWTRSFWLGPVQRRLGRRLARISDRLVTSVPLYGEILASWTGRDDVSVLPIPSTVGEPERVAPPADRRPRMVVFGTPGTRRRVYAEHRQTLVAACRALDLSEIADVGGPADGAPGELDGIPVVLHGALPAPAVSGILADSRCGFLVYPEDLVDKSSIFAAYSAHGLVTVCAGPPIRRWKGPDGSRRRFLAPRDLDGRPDAATLRAVADRAWLRYREHSVGRHAELLARWLAG